MLRYKGSKKMIADDLRHLFPPHTSWIEPFFGVGGMFFKKRKARYNFLNDLNDDVYNLWQIIQNQPQALQQKLAHIPQHQSIFEEFKVAQPTDPLQKAVRFVYLSTLSYLGSRETMCSKPHSNTYQIALQTIPIYSQLLQNCKLFKADFRDFLKLLSFKDAEERQVAFVYADPPYLNTTGYFHKWAQQDLIDLTELLKAKHLRFAISEFDTTFNRSLADKYELNYHLVKERRNLSNRKTEVLMTNYHSQAKLF